MTGEEQHTIGTPHKGEESVAVGASTNKKHRIELVTGVFGICGVLVGGLLTVAASLWTQSIANHDSEMQQAREKRAEVYFDYLKSADAYETDTANLLSSYAAGHKNKNFQLPANLIQKFDDDRSAYQNQVNDLYVFGSDQAWIAHQRLAATLPTSLSVEVAPLTIHYDPLAFNNAYDGFLSVTCLEVSPEPRAGCR